MRRLLRLLSRYVRTVEVRPARPEDLMDCVEMAYAACLEDGERPSASMALALETHLANVIGRTAAESAPPALALLSVVAGEVTGMVCCALSGPEPHRQGLVCDGWLLYVKPEHRRVALPGGIWRPDPRSALALMRGVLAAAEHWGAAALRVTMNEAAEQHRRRYERNLGFKVAGAQRIYRLAMTPEGV